MPETLPIRCDCGHVHGHVDLRDHDARRAVCYCRDCRMFAHFLKRADTVLDRHGGTEVAQISQGRLRFDAGREHLACMRLTPKGILRWYTACCLTPIGNVLANRHLPYLGLIHTCIDFEACVAPMESILGSIDCRIHTHDPELRRRYTNAHATIPPTLLIRTGMRVLGWRLRGDHRDSPLFERESGRPIATPRILDADEWAALRAAVT